VPNGRPKRSSSFNHTGRHPAVSHHSYSTNMKSTQRSLPTVKARQNPGSATPHIANPRAMHSNRPGKGHSPEESIATSVFDALVCLCIYICVCVCVCVSVCVCVHMCLCLCVCMSLQNTESRILCLCVCVSVCLCVCVCMCVCMCVCVFVCLFDGCVCAATVSNDDEINN
jgi:hypothetical protein